MKFVLEIDSNGDPFSDQDFPVRDELARILHGLANHLHGSELDSLDGVSFSLKDSEGNEVGHATASS